MAAMRAEYVDSAERDVDDLSSDAPERDEARALTAREAAVAELVARGATNRRAAEVLFVSPKTVEFHLTRIYRKLGVTSRTELAWFVATSGLVSAASGQGAIRSLVAAMP